PTAVKLQTKVSSVLVNAAECEPLLHKDKELLHHYAPEVLKGLKIAMNCVGAKEAVIGIKEKYHDVMDALRPQLPANVSIFSLTDTYPAGDEFLMVHDITGKVIPPGGLPRDVDTVVANVETLMNIGIDEPVTHKYLTVAGAVATPVTLRVPVGTPFRDVITAAGGATAREIGVLLGGAMMGELVKSLDDPVTKTLGGVIVLPREHPLIQRYEKPWKQIHHIGKSACDQCRMCTDLCPRYLLGHPIEPHGAMRALLFGAAEDELHAATLYCCECNLCTMFACPEDLDPKNVCVQAKPTARRLDMTYKGPREDIVPHPMADFRRIPTKRLMLKLGLADFENVGPLVEHRFSPARVKLPLKQHAGAPAVAAVKAGDSVRVGDLLAAPAAGALGARIHASIDGVITGTDGAVVIEAR
ncbi:MAG TPA: 4Fe-4S dicluster domain-containing protein, partial [Fimbriimonadaceae bacterium]|nr:4Fe-4S dicluster domain-containing protein [Fimbriimonadaceae bacterium]